MGNTQTVLFENYKAIHRRNIAEGGFGFVTEVVDEKGNRFAMKRVIVPMDDKERNKVALNEQVILATLPNHPNVVHFYAACQHEILDKKQRHYCTLMEFCEGNVWDTMVEYKNRGETFSERQICSIFRDACLAIHHLHSQMPPIAHRDLKVENLLLGLDGNYKLTDFGSCSTNHGLWISSRDIKIKEEDISKHTTLAYRSPEQVDLYLQKRVSEKVDVWALGVLLYVLTTGRTPFCDALGNTEKLGILSGKVSFPSEWGYSQGLRDFIMFLLHPDVDERPSIHDVLSYGASQKSSGALPHWPGLPSGSAIWPSSDPDTSPTRGAKNMFRTSRSRKGSSLSSPTTTTTSSSSKLPAPSSPSTSPRALPSPDKQTVRRQQPSQSPAIDSDRRSRADTEGSHRSNVTPRIPSTAATATKAAATTPTSAGESKKQMPLRNVSMPSLSRPPPLGGADIQRSHMSSQRRTSTTSPPSEGFSQQSHPQWGNGGEAGRTSDAVDTRLMEGGGSGGGVTREAGSTPPSVSTQRFASGALRHAISGKARQVGESIVSIMSHASSRLDGEQEALSWVRKATNSRQAGFPKAKHLRHIVVALWEGQMSVDWLLLKLSQRPWSDSTLVSCKLLVTLMKVMQQGPPKILSSYIKYVDFIDQLERHWKMFQGDSVGRSSTARAPTAEALSSHHIKPVPQPDSTFMVVFICKFAGLLRQKLHFHSFHPEFGTHFTTLAKLTGRSTLPSNLSLQSIPGVLSRLLTIQTSIQVTQKSIFKLSSQCDDSVDSSLTLPTSEDVVTAQAALLPILEESYVLFIACLHLLEALCDGTENNDPVTAALREQFNDQFISLHDFYSRCHRIPFVSNMDCIPVLPARNPLDETSPARVDSHADELPWDPFRTTCTGSDEKDNSVSIWKSLFSVDSDNVDAVRCHFSVLEAKLEAGGVPSDVDEQDEFDPFCLYTTLPEAAVSQPSSAAAPVAVTMRRKSLLDAPAPATAATSHTQHADQTHSRPWQPSTAASPTTKVSQFHESPQYSIPPYSGHHHPTNNFFTTTHNSEMETDKAFVLDNFDFNPFDFKNDKSIEPKAADAIWPAAVAATAFPAAPSSSASASFSDFEAFETTPFGFFEGNQTKAQTSTSATTVGRTVGNNPFDDLKSSTVLVPAASSTSASMMTPQGDAMYCPHLQPWRTTLLLPDADPSLRNALGNCLSSFSTWGLEVAFSSLEVEGVIGSGAFAVVYKAKFKKNGVKVAVKKLLSTAGQQLTAKTLRDFVAEVDFMRTLRHKNIVDMLATCSEPICVLMEFCDRGNLMAVLQDTSVDLSPSLRRSLMADIARGMAYLHSRDPVIIHRDLKSLNILITTDWVAKITDFGLSRQSAESDQNNMMTGQIGTFHWMAPEVISGTDYTAKADIYSFAIIAWEILTRQTPFPGMHPVQIVAAVCNSHLRPTLPVDAPSDLKDLIAQCWSASPQSRPPFSEIYTRLLVPLQLLGSK